MALNRPVSQRGKGRPKKLSRIEDFALYCVIGVGMVAAAMLAGIYTSIEPNRLFKWLGFAGMTAYVFGDTIRTNRTRWGQRRFWLLLVAFFVAQCGLGIVVLWTVPKVPTIIWAFLIPLDYIALGVFLDFSLEPQR